VVDHDFRKDTGIPFLKKQLNFKINWYSDTDEVAGKPPTKLDEFAKLLQDKGGDSFKRTLSKISASVFGGAVATLAGVGGLSLIGVGEVLAVAAVIGGTAYFLTSTIYDVYKNSTTRIGKEFKTPYSNVEFYFRDLNTK
jgi:hypothetical protein